MNLVLLESRDFIAEARVRVADRRRDHILRVHRAAVGDVLRVGLLHGNTGFARIQTIDPGFVELAVERLDSPPPQSLPLCLILALPRPKVLNRTIAAAASMGIKEIHLINTWRVEKAYWSSPRLAEQNLRLQSILGLEQAVDTVPPTVQQHRLFVPFIRDELPRIVESRRSLLAHPGGTECPRRVEHSIVLGIGPEGGFIEREVASFQEAGFEVVSTGARILRVESALAYIAGRLF